MSTAQEVDMVVEGDTKWGIHEFEAVVIILCAYQATMGS